MSVSFRLIALLLCKSFCYDCFQHSDVCVPRKRWNFCCHYCIPLAKDELNKTCTDGCWYCDERCHDQHYRNYRFQCYFYILCVIFLTLRKPTAIHSLKEFFCDRITELSPITESTPQHGQNAVLFHNISSLLYYHLHLFLQVSFPWAIPLYQMAERFAGNKSSRIYDHFQHIFIKHTIFVRFYIIIRLHFYYLLLGFIL